MLQLGNLNLILVLCTRRSVHAFIVLSLIQIIFRSDRNWTEGPESVRKDGRNKYIAVGGSKMADILRI